MNWHLDSHRTCYLQDGRKSGLALGSWGIQTGIKGGTGTDLGACGLFLVVSEGCVIRAGALQRLLNCALLHGFFNTAEVDSL